MIGLTILGLLISPIIFVTSLRFRWALSAFILSIPWKTAVLATAVGHKFVLPEVTIIILICHMGRRVITKKIKLPMHLTNIALLGFGGAATISVLTLLFQPPTGLLGRPYNIATGYGAFTLVPISFSVDALTQLALRWFFVVSTVSLGVVFSTRNRILPWVLRITVYNALLVGWFGILYQLSLLGGIEAFPEGLQSLGFARFPVSPGTLGALPRMFSITGEPGATAHFLLFALVITSLTALSEDEGVFDRLPAAVFSVMLLGLIILTTGTTGYGGLIVFVILLFATALLTESVHFKTVTIVVSSTIVLGITIVGILALVTDLGIIRTMSVQLDKLQFSAQSGSLRARYIAHSLSLWAKRPLFGTGVGTQNGTSFLASSLAETGLLGGAALVGAVLMAYRSGVATEQSVNDSVVVTTAVAAATVGIVALVARSSASSLFPWLWLALALPNSNLYKGLRDCPEN